MTSKQAKAQAQLQAKRISKKLENFIKDHDCVMTINLGILEIHAFKLDSDGVKIYNHVNHDLTPKYKGRTTTAQRSKIAVKNSAGQKKLVKDLQVSQ